MSGRSLPARVAALRGRVFARVNGDKVLTFPDALIGPDRFQEVYSHPAAVGRSKGAGLSDLFWYWLSPGPEVHQEHLEPGPRYDEVARTTLSLLAGPSRKLAEAATRCTARVLDGLPPGRAAVVRLRDLMMPVWAEYFHDLVFTGPCPPEARDLIVAHAEDVVSALKCTGLRHPARRARLTRYLAARLAAGQVRLPLPDVLSEEDKAHYLQGMFFTTAVVQMSDAMAHVLLVLAQHPEVARRVAEDPGDDRYLGHVLDETMRLYPLFGIAHRVTTGDIALEGHPVIPAGSVLCFDYPAYHATGYADPHAFDPDRWERTSARTAHHIPFGVAANRPCPAWRIAPLAMRAATREVLRRYRLHSTVSHTRALPSRGPCLLEPVDARPRPRRRAALGALLLARDRWEELWLGLVQLVLGTGMVLHARRLRLAGRYFQTHDTQGCPLGRGPASGKDVE